MGAIDLIVAPIYFVLFTIIAVYSRPFLTNQRTKKYFLPALWVKLVGAIFFGVIYLFYYSGGDTLNYFDQGSEVYHVLLKDTILGLKLIFMPYVEDPELLAYSLKIHWYNSPSEYMIVRIIGFLSLFTFNSYVGISFFFAFFSFIGVWLLFSVMNSFSEHSKLLALSILFVPTVVFWGSGIMKDSVALGSFGIVFWILHQFIEKRRRTIGLLVVLLIACWLLYIIKIYILLCLIPFVMVWLYYKFFTGFNNWALKSLLIPIVFSVLVGLSLVATKLVSDNSSKYQLDQLAQRAYITSYDIRYFSGKDAGSGYSIGEQDGTWPTLLKLTPAAINVTLFRPYLWEVKNPLMLLSALEALAVFLLTIFSFPKLIFGWQKLPPILKASLIFCIVFAFAVGVSSYNFGTLSRYKIPMLPLYLSALIFVNQKNSHDE